MGFISGMSDRIEDDNIRQRRIADYMLRYNMLHGEHGLFSVGENLDERLAKLDPVQRDTLAKSMESCSERIRLEASTQGGMPNRELSAVADKVAQAASQVREGNFKDAQKTLVQGATKAMAAGYPGIADDVASTGTSALNALTGAPLIQPVDILMDKNVGMETGHEDIPPSTVAPKLSGIDYGTLG